MRVVYQRCCGLDVHRKMVVACVLLTEDDGRLRRQVRTFGTMSADLLALSDWLDTLGVEQIAMESTGKHRGLLEADLPRAGGALRRRPRQRRARQNGPSTIPRMEARIARRRSLRSSTRPTRCTG